MRRGKRARRFTVAVAVLLCAATVVASQESPTPVERFTAVAKRTLAGGVSSESALEIVILQWATREDLDALSEVLRTSGQQAFVVAARGRPVAGAMHEFLRQPVVGRRVHTLTLAISCSEIRCYGKGYDPQAGTRRVILVIAGESGSVSFLQFELDKDGGGDGFIVDDAAVRYDPKDGRIHLADLGGIRARLSYVRSAAGRR